MTFSRSRVKGQGHGQAATDMKICERDCSWDTQEIFLFFYFYFSLFYFIFYLLLITYYYFLFYFILFFTSGSIGPGVKNISSIIIEIVLETHA